VDPALIAIAGPTGAGKTALALELATAFGGEIVNCDSLQLYRGFNIGTAKTPVAARRDTPHHLFDVLEPANGYSAGDYARLARQTIAEISASGRLPIVVGGSGFYLRALLEGLHELPSRDQAVRARLQVREQRRPGSLHRLLTRLQPATARHIHPRDVQKLIRALEIRLLTSARDRSSPPQSEKPEAIGSRQAPVVFPECRFSKRAALPRPARRPDPLAGYNVLKIALNPDRSLLFQRLDERVHSMFSGGLIEEVRSLLAKGATGDEKPFESLGYRQAIQYIRGEVKLEQAILSTQTGTRQYAKRQWTWCRSDPEIRWLHGFGDQPEVVRQALELAAEAIARG